jgi:type IV secretory pathway VirB10-like protein
MHHRSIAILAIVCLASSAGGCASFLKPSKPKSTKSKKGYEEVLMPLQTGSVLHRRAYIERGPESEKKPKKKKPTPLKPEAEASATPAPEEESTPPPDRFR